MAWTVELSKVADRQFNKLDRPTQQSIADFIDHRLSVVDDPRSLGRALSGPHLGKFWRFRVGDYRLIGDIQDNRVVIFILEIDHRSAIYR